jgi:histidyl-tRNA synthetase
MFQAVRGMQDNLPDITSYWEQLETQLKSLMQSYAYQEIRFPIVEKTALFQHSIGTVTDIVEKEMYVFSDSKGQSLSLRPEGTAGCLRAAIERKLIYQNQPQRLWYFGPMFRRERPQKGRYRQFHQFGVEAFGMSNPEIDMELILIGARLWKNLGISQTINLELNSLGNALTRENHRAALIHYFNQHYTELDEDSKRRLGSNPLRILDSKNPKMQPLIQEAPRLLDYLDEESATHFEQLQRLLNIANVPFIINPRLVRGLDYYNKTVFEWVMVNTAGAQNTVCAGGRYDSLPKQLGGPQKAAIGFAIGLERLLELWLSHHNIQPVPIAPHIYLIKQGERATQEAVILAENLRTHLPEIRLHMDCAGGTFSQQFKRANESKALLALVLGDNEVQTQEVTVKHLLTSEPQRTIAYADLINYLKQALK